MNSQTVSHRTTDYSWVPGPRGPGATVLSHFLPQGDSLAHSLLVTGAPPGVCECAKGSGGVWGPSETICNISCVHFSRVDCLARASGSQRG